MVGYYQVKFPGNVDSVMETVLKVCEERGKIKKLDKSDHTIKVKFKAHGWAQSVKFQIILHGKGEETMMVAMGSPWVTGALDTEKPGDVYDLQFDPFIQTLAEIYRLSDIVTPATLIEAQACGSDVEQITATKGKDVSLGRAAMGGALFGGAGAVVGGLSGTKTSTTHSRQVFADKIPFRLFYSNGRIIEKMIWRDSTEYAKIMAMSQL